MLSINRKFNYKGELIMHKSNVADSPDYPKDEKVNWLFLKLDNHLFSFVYKAENLEEAKYGEPFYVDLAFTMVEEVSKYIKFNNSYEILKGQETIGSVIITSSIASFSDNFC
jgi:hypothetical protein